MESHEQASCRIPDQPRQPPPAARSKSSQRFLVTFPDRTPVAFQMGLFSTRRDDFVLIELTSHQPDLHAFVRSLMPGDASADDVVQQANLVVWRKRSTFKQGTDFRSWLFAIARLEVLAHRKKAGRRSWLVIDDALTQSLSDSIGVRRAGNPLGSAPPRAGSVHRNPQARRAVGDRALLLLRRKPPHDGHGRRAK